jgi:hypothetical protein
MAKTTKKAASDAPARSSRRMKCACASCTCTVDMMKALQRGNLVFCSEACASRACTLEICRCEHDSCGGT